jgi:hypothetical protein
VGRGATSAPPRLQVRVMPIDARVVLAVAVTGISLWLMAWGGRIFRRGPRSLMDVTNGVLFIGLGVSLMLMMSAAWITIFLPTDPAAKVVAEGLYAAGFVVVVLVAPVARYCGEEWARKRQGHPRRSDDFVEDADGNAVATEPERDDLRGRR